MRRPFSLIQNNHPAVFFRAKCSPVQPIEMLESTVPPQGLDCSGQGPATQTASPSGHCVGWCSHAAFRARGQISQGHSATTVPPRPSEGSVMVPIRTFPIVSHLGTITSPMGTITALIPSLLLCMSTESPAETAGSRARSKAWDGSQSSLRTRKHKPWRHLCPRVLLFLIASALGTVLALPSRQGEYSTARMWASRGRRVRTDSITQGLEPLDDC